METKSFICINCPLGCPLTVTVENGEVKSVTGNTCKRGELYAVKEVTAPARTVTSTVRVLNGERPVVAVRTKTDIPKGKIFRLHESHQRSGDHRSRPYRRHRHRKCLRHRRKRRRFCGRRVGLKVFD